MTQPGETDGYTASMHAKAIIDHAGPGIIDYMIVNGLRHKEHPSHQSIDDAIAFAQKLGVKEAWLIHMSHHIQKHQQEEKSLPAGIHLAYDGEVIEF